MEIPKNFEIERKYKNDFGTKYRKFRLIKVYDKFALYECYRLDRENNKIHLFNECFSFSYLCSGEYKTEKVD